MTKRRFPLATVLLAHGCHSSPPGDEPPRPPQPAAADAAPEPQPDPEQVATVDWFWSSTPDLYPLADIVVRHGSDRFVLGQRPIPVPSASGFPKGGKPQLSRLGPGGEVVWSVSPTMNDDSLAGAAMVVDDKRVYVADYQRIATGCRLSAFSVADGKRLWSVALEGLGPIGHSKYSNHVDMTLAKGEPTVFGSESAGRYIETRASETGAQGLHRKLPAAERPTNLAEPLYRELDLVLSRRRSTTIEVADFLTRHGLGGEFPEDAARREAAKKAASALEGTPLAGGPDTLAIELDGKGAKLAWRATRRPPPKP